MPAFLDPKEAEFWVGAGLLIFLGIVIFVAKVPAMIAAALDAKAAGIRNELEEAQRIREEAQALLAQLKAERAAAEAQAEAMIAEARQEAERLGAEARTKLEETLARRQSLAERRIELAETQALADVKAAAADLAAHAAETVLADRLKGRKTDPAVDRAVERMAARLA